MEKNIIILNADSKPENIIGKAVQIKPQKEESEQIVNRLKN